MIGSNQIDGNGIQVQSYTDIVTELVTEFQTIYGSDVNTGANTPDGNLINILALSKADMLDLNVQTYNSFDIDQAVGVALDRAAQYCGISRKGGVYTQVTVQVVAASAITLAGNDTSSPFTVSDTNGNLFQLVTSATLSVGSNSLTFIAVKIGYLQILANTLTVQVTPVLGVTSVNNSAVPTINGSDQETDAQLRIRIQRSNGLSGTGDYSRLLASILQISGLTNAMVFVNNGATTDGHTVPAHSVWVVVDGGADADVANAIYSNLPAGCGMKGSTSINVTQVDSSTYAILFDRVVAQNLYVKFAVASKTSASIDQTALAAYLSANYILTINQMADITSLSALVYKYSNDLYITGVKVSKDNTNWYDDLFPTTVLNKYVLTAAHVTFL